MRQAVHLEKLVLLENVLEHFDANDLHLPAVHLHNAIEALREYVANADGCRPEQSSDAA